MCEHLNIQFIWEYFCFSKIMQNLALLLLLLELLELTFCWVLSGCQSCKVWFWGRCKEHCGYLDFSTHLLVTYSVLVLLCRNRDVECQTVFPNNFSCWNDLLKGPFRFSLTSEVKQWLNKDKYLNLGSQVQMDESHFVLPCCRFMLHQRRFDPVSFYIFIEFK